MDGIVVSNHGMYGIASYPYIPQIRTAPDLTWSSLNDVGGRQVDGAIPSLYALEQIMKSEKIRTAQRCGVLTTKLKGLLY